MVLFLKSNHIQPLGHPRKFGRKIGQDWPLTRRPLQRPYHQPRGSQIFDFLRHLRQARALRDPEGRHARRTALDPGVRHGDGGLQVEAADYRGILQAGHRSDVLRHQWGVQCQTESRQQQSRSGLNLAFVLPKLFFIYLFFFKILPALFGSLLLSGSIKFQCASPFL